jgi:TnpA family transposase
MARRSLLTGDERRRLFELPVDDREVARHYTLSAEDLKWIDARHGPGNQLGAAVQLALLRHPGFGLRASETVPSPVLRFLADQIHAPVTAFAEYARRNQTRLEHAGQLHQRLGLRPFARADIRHAVESATAAAWSTDKGRPRRDAPPQRRCGAPSSGAASFTAPSPSCCGA